MSGDRLAVAGVRYVKSYHLTRSDERQHRWSRDEGSYSVGSTSEVGSLLDEIERLRAELDRLRDPDQGGARVEVDDLGAIFADDKDVGSVWTVEDRDVLRAALRGEPRPSDEGAIDAAHLAHQREWSERTFGPGPRTLGVLDHIRKELREIEADPDDLGEWVDVIILAFDGAWRAGWEPQEIIDAIKTKQARNEARDWPDWRTMSPDQAIEHVRGSDS